MRFIVFTANILVILVLLATGAIAEKRVALVIGNSSYTAISPLTNPKNDVELMSQALRGVGFDVVMAVDADRATMGGAIRNFGAKLRAAGKDAVGLFYFAGHGVQARGTNYLIPIGSIIQNEADLDIEAFSASDVLVQMETANNRLNLVILDSCRNNPFNSAVRSAARGLARLSASSGSLVAFSAAPGQVAVDGEGTNSPYTAALAEAINVRGLSVEQVFKRVRVSVENQTAGTQTPWEESSLRGEFYFRPKAIAKSDSRMELAYWETVKDSNDVLLLKSYLKQYPQGTFAPLASSMIEKIENLELRREAEVTQPTSQDLPSDRNEQTSNTEIDRVDLIYATSFGSGETNATAIAILRKNDGKIIYLDTVNADVVVFGEYMKIIDNCFEDKIDSKIFEGHLSGASFPIPTEIDIAEDVVSCHTVVQIDSLDTRAYPTSHGGTGIVNILVRKKFLVNVLYSGALTTFNLREVN